MCTAFCFSFVTWWTFELFLFLAIMQNAAIEMCGGNFLMTAYLPYLV